MNPVAKKLSAYVEDGLLSKNFVFGDGDKIHLLWEAIAEIKRLEGLLLEERAKFEAELKKRKPLSGNQIAKAGQLDELFKAMQID